MKRKLFSLFTAILLILSLSACKSKEVYRSESKPVEISSVSDKSSETSVTSDGASAESTASSAQTGSVCNKIGITDSSSYVALPIIAEETGDTSSKQKSEISSVSVSEPASASSDGAHGDDRVSSTVSKSDDVQTSSVAVSSDSVIVLPTIPFD